MNVIPSIVFLIVTSLLPGPSIAAKQESVSSRKEESPVPKVVVSIPPFYAIISEIMQGISKPTLLITTGSTHHAVLSPSQRKSLEEASLIFWGGPELETFLIHPLKMIDTDKTKVVELDKTPKLHYWNTRFSPDYNDEEPGTQADHNHAHVHGSKDMHFWLDPENGLLLADYITATLIKTYPRGRTQFERNRDALKNRLKILDKSLKIKLSPIKDKPYLVLHDGYQYFEKHYGLNAVGAITHHPELPISVARMQKIREMIEKNKVACIFTEPKVSTTLTESLAKEYHLRTGVLDPMERPLEGEYRYEHLFEGLSDSLLKCLKPRE